METKVNIEKQYILTPYIIYHHDENEMVNVIDGQKIEYNEKLIQLLKYCQTPKSETELIQLFGDELINAAKEKYCICEPDQMYKINKLLLIEIGITNYCNNRCVYCPVKDHPAVINKVMDMQLFNKIIDYAQANDRPFLTLNFYNEPTLDPLFKDRIIRIGQTDLKYTLQTNGSGLTEEKLNLIIKYEKNLHELIINIPSIDSAIYKKMTGSPLTDHLIENVDRAARNCEKIKIVVIGTKEEIDQNLPDIQKKFPCRVFPTRAHDVAGAVINDYNENINVIGRFVGCPTVTQSININAYGDVFLCSRDFFQKDPIGNAFNQNIDEILISAEAQRIRKIVFGGCDGDYACKKCAYMRFYQKSNKYVQVIRMFEKGENIPKDFTS